MRRLTKRIIVTLVVFVLLMSMALNVSAASKPINLNHTGSNYGNHTYESFTLSAASWYYFKEEWHSGSFTSIGVTINGVSIGDLPSSAMNSEDGYPVEYSGSKRPQFTVTLNRGSGAAGFGGRINY